jgi:hypothetical protein
VNPVATVINAGGWHNLIILGVFLVLLFGWWRRPRWLEDWLHRRGTLRVDAEKAGELRELASEVLNRPVRDMEPLSTTMESLIVQLAELQGELAALETLLRDEELR